jgi:mRNA-degrading endonuclease RelE of RelBE toxin-antitoxin system
MTYSILLGDQPRDYLAALGEKDERICKENLRKLEEHPYPGRGKGDKEAIPVDGEELYRLHIGRTHTAFYEILEGAGQVRIVEILPIDEAHDRYGF